MKIKVPHSVSREEIYMDNLLFFILGILIGLVLFKKPVEFVIHHKNENIVPQLPEEVMPKMSDIDKTADPEEDKVYEEMGKIMDNVTEIFSGSDRV